MNLQTDDQTQGRFDDAADTDVTAEQLAELRRLGIVEADLQGLTSAVAEDWIDELRTRRRDADRFGPLRRQRTP